MAILDMIPAEYWRQLRSELNALDWDEIEIVEAATIRQAEQAERERREKVYNEAIRRKRLAEQKKRRNTDEWKLRNREAQTRYRIKHGISPNEPF